MPGRYLYPVTVSDMQFTTRLTEENCARDALAKREGPGAAEPFRKASADGNQKT